MLYLVPTPIGNLADIAPRSLEILANVDYILSEDTRTTGKLLSLLGISKAQQSFHAHNEHHRIKHIVEELQNGRTIALVSDAGTPGISDPGYLLVRACHQNDLPVSCLPGPTAFVPALAASGIPSDRFHFEGFLPQKKGRLSRWSYLKELPHTFILYESPFRLLKCLAQVIEHCGHDRIVCVAREISKMHEEIITLTATEMLTHFEAYGKIKGEIVLVVEGAKNK